MKLPFEPRPSDLPHEPNLLFVAFCKFPRIPSVTIRAIRVKNHLPLALRLPHHVSRFTHSFRTSAFGSRPSDLRITHHVSSICHRPSATQETATLRLSSIPQSLIPHTKMQVCPQSAQNRTQPPPPGPLPPYDLKPGINSQFVGQYQLSGKPVPVIK